MSHPPLASLRVFEAVARHRSFTAAAAELGMTQAAVSWQIKSLEGRLGAALFLRKPKGVELTELGARLAPSTADAFALLRDGWQALDRAVGERLAISTLATFAGNWLAQRLGRFQVENPGISVRMEVSDQLIDFARDDFDVAIRYGRGDWPGLEAHALFAADFSPMMAPALAAGLRQPADILTLPRVDSDDPLWSLWLEAAGVRNPDPPPRPRLVFGTQIHEARAAAAGAGAAMLTPRFFRLEVATGTLVQPFPLLATNGKGYWLAYPHSRRNRPAIRQLRRFLLEEVAAETGARAPEPPPETP